MDGGAWWATVHGVTRVGQDLVMNLPPPPVFFFVCLFVVLFVCFHYRYSCLENPMDRGAWRATVPGRWHKKLDTTEHTHMPALCTSPSSPR